MKKLLKSRIYGSINSAQMHCLLQEIQPLLLLFNKQYINSIRITPKRVKKKKEQNVKIKRRRSKSPIQTGT